MSLPRVRFTVRRVMIVVAVVGFVMWGVHLRQLSIIYAYTALCRRATAEEIEKGLRVRESRNPSTKYVEGMRRMAIVNEQLAADYERSARYLWLSPPPDSRGLCFPPDPK